VNATASYTHEQGGQESATQPWWASTWRYRFALQNLVLKDFRLRYRNMSLGVFWSIINPLVMLGVLLIVFTYIHPNRNVNYFPVFLLIGLFFYNIVAMIVPPSTSAISNNANLVKKVIFPRVMIPLAMVLSQMIHVAIKFGILVFFLIVYSVPFNWTWLWIFPVMITMLVFVTGMAFACSALAIQYRDIQYVVESGLSISFWLTPIFYDLLQVKLNLSRPLYLLYLTNPVAGCIDSARRALLSGQHPDSEVFGMAIASSLAVLAAGFFIFNRKQKLFADNL
jgi:ABC-type polysaccharide/polyol phosphate export permease